MILGKTLDHQPLSIDLDRLLVTRLLIQGSSGSGKSRTLRRLLEVTFGHVQHIVIDIEGEFHTLREKFDYILASKDGGDCPADAASAHVLAQRILELGISAIVDIYELHPEERIEFVRLFLESLMQAPKKLWRPVLIVIDEAQRFCPESGNKELKGVIAAMKDLMGRGRKRGFCPVLAVQRLSDLDKTAAAECLNKLIGRTGLDIDRARAGKELGFIGNDSTKLRSLDDGHFYAFGPALSRDVTQILVDDVITSHPRPGQRSTVQTAAPERIKAVLAQLANIPREAEEEATTIEDLRLEVSRLRQQLDNAGSGGVDPEEMERAVMEAQARAREESTRVMDSRLQDVLIEKTAIERELAEIRTSLQKIGDLASFPVLTASAPPQPLPFRFVRPPAPTKATAPKQGDGSGLGRGEKAILMAIAQINRTTAGPCSRIQASVISGYSITSSGFANSMGKLRSAGYLSGSGDDNYATPRGCDCLGTIPAVPAGKELLAFWASRLGKAERTMLETITQHTSLSKDALSRHTGYSITSSGFANAIGRLRSLGLVHGRDPIQASELFRGVRR